MAEVEIKPESHDKGFARKLVMGCDIPKYSASILIDILSRPVPEAHNADICAESEI